MAEFVGGFIDEKVIAQLLKRSNIYGKKDKTVDDIHFMNSRNAWVRVISSVDTLNPITIPLRITFDNSDAKNYVLSNISSIKGTGDNLSFEVNSGIDFNKRNSDTSYQYSENIGVRPKPGITSFSVITKNRFGTIREANIAFNVWSVEDLDAIERLYFRPGYSCIVEWGHTVYVDNNGKVQTVLPGTNSNLKDYFDSTKTFNSIQSLLSQNTKNESGNYQSFVGFIKNFNWSFRKDGGYDCSISVISQGEILESLKMTFDNADKLDTTQKESKYEHNLIYKFLLDLRKETSGDVDPKSGIPTRLVNLNDIENAVESVNNLNIYRNTPGSITKGGVKPIAVKKYARNTGKKDYYYYFPLRTLIHLLNEGFSIVGKDCQKIAEIDSLSLEQYFTFKDHFSSDPLTCILPNKKIKLEEETYTVEIDTTVSNYIKLIEGAGREENRGIKVLDLLITDLLVERALENKPENVATFLNYILSEITKALGGVNEFIIQEVGDSLKLQIKDMALVPNNKTDEILNRKAEIPLSGLRSILTDLKIQSKISKDLASMIAIGAQSGPNRSAEDITTLTQWNAGLQDRFAGDKNQGSLDCGVEDDIQEENKAEKPAWVNTRFTEDLYALYLRFIKWKNRPSVKEIEKSFTQIAAEAYYNLYFINNTANYNASLFETVKNKGLTYFKQKAAINFLPEESKEQDQSSAKNIVAKGVIPVELSFTTDGIGGIKIGQAFRVSPGVLPKKYDEFGYIIVGVDHSIENNRWYTNVRSQLFIIPGEVKTGDTNLVVDIESGQTATDDQVPGIVNEIVRNLNDNRFNRSNKEYADHLRATEYNILSNDLKRSYADKFGPSYPRYATGLTEEERRYFEPEFAGMRFKLIRLITGIRNRALAKNSNAVIRISSGYRTQAENEATGGAPTSYHLDGMAADLVPVKGISLQDLAQIATDLGAGGIGVYDKHIHVDIGQQRAIFKGRSK